MPKVITVIAVRMGSERFPGKTLYMIGGKPLLEHLLDRVKRASAVDAVVVATPDTRENDAVEAFCIAYGVPCYRGEENDIVARMLGALESQKADIGVQVYGDGPLVDPGIIDTCIGIFLKGNYDLAGNDLKPTIPSGAYVEVFSVEKFRDSAKRIEDSELRGHGTRFMRLHPEIYKLKNIETPQELQRPDIHLEVDAAEDMRLMEAIFEHFVPRHDFTLLEVIHFLDENPEVSALNKRVHRRWKESIEQTSAMHEKHAE